MIGALSVIAVRCRQAIAMSTPDGILRHGVVASRSPRTTMAIRVPSTIRRE